MCSLLSAFSISLLIMSDADAFPHLADFTVCVRVCVCECVSVCVYVHIIVAFHISKYYLQINTVVNK